MESVFTTSTILEYMTREMAVGVIAGISRKFPGMIIPAENVADFLTTVSGDNCPERSAELIYDVCCQGYYELASILAPNSGDFYIDECSYELNAGLRGACEGGHKDIVNLMIKKGATRCEYYSVCTLALEDH